MKTILVPTDFSATAMNAAQYAIGLAQQTKSEKIILYHCYQSVATVGIDPMIPVVTITDQDLEESNKWGMQQFAEKLKPLCGSHICLDTITEMNVLPDGVFQICNSEKIDLIVMGITGGNELEAFFLGSHSLVVANSTQVPVLIVPQNSVFEPVHKIIWACDFDHIYTETPITPIQMLLNATQAKLLVLNLQYTEVGITDFIAEKEQLDSMFGDYKPTYYFGQNNYFTEGINAFVEEQKAHWIMAIPKKHDWLDRIFKRSHTKQLAFHTKVPLLLMHK